MPLTIAEQRYELPGDIQVPEGKVDTRTKEGRKYKRQLATWACRLKQEGWPITAIAEALKVSPPTVSAYVSFRDYGGGGHLHLAITRPTHRATEDACSAPPRTGDGLVSEGEIKASLDLHERTRTSNAEPGCSERG